MSNYKKEIVKKSIKYIINWLTIMLTLKFVLSENISNKQMMIVATISSVMFVILDMYAPFVVYKEKNKNN